MRLGGTSFLIPASYVDGVRYAAERCDDVTLLLIAPGPHGEFLPTPAEIAQIATILDDTASTLSVHLPTEENFDRSSGAQRMAESVCRCLDRTAKLNPHTFVLHTDFPSLHEISLKKKLEHLSEDMIGWTQESLVKIMQELPNPEMLAVENLAGFPLSFWDTLLKGLPCSRCLDVGHLWKDGENPALFGKNPNIRIVHLHGVKKDSPVAHIGQSGAVPKMRDHVSLAEMPPDHVDSVLRVLENFQGVVTLEVYNPQDFATSLDTLRQSCSRIAQKSAKSFVKKIVKECAKEYT